MHVGVEKRVGARRAGPRTRQNMAGWVGILSPPTRFARPAKTKIPAGGVHNGVGLAR